MTIEWRAKNLSLLRGFSIGILCLAGFFASAAAFLAAPSQASVKSEDLSGTSQTGSDAEKPKSAGSKRHGKAAARYKAPKEMNLDRSVVEGQLRRPELSVVTGDSERDSEALLRLRQNFQDHIQADAGKEIR